MSRVAFFLSGFGILTLAACSSGGSNGTTTGASGPTITISNFTFSPDPLVVAAGSTVTVNNADNVNVHTATSNGSTDGGFVKGQADGGFAFDTGNIPTSGSATFIVPAGLPSGTVQPYFCEQHMGMMHNPNPTIKIQ